MKRSPKSDDLQKSLVSARIRKRKILAALIIFIYCLILKGGILDGWHRCYYIFQRALAKLYLAIDLI